MEELYTELYIRLTSCVGESGRIIIATALQWLLCARRTLSSSWFLWAVSIKQPDNGREVTREEMLDLCQNLIVYDEGLDTFRFAHLSVREFLEKRADFSEVSCNVAAAECCLLHIIAMTNHTDQALALGDDHITDLRHRMNSSPDSTPSDFSYYAYSFWIVHCSSASENSRTANTNFGYLFRYIASSEATNQATFDTWTQWYLTTPCIEEPYMQLRILLRRYKSYRSRSFFISVAYGFIEIVEMYIEKEHISAQEQELALTLAMVCRQRSVIDLIIENFMGRNITLSVLRCATRYLDTRRFSRLLEGCTKIQLDRHILEDVGRYYKNDGRLGLLLAKDHEFTITNEILESVVHTVSLEDVRLLVNCTANGNVSMKALQSAMLSPWVGPLSPKVDVLLEKAEDLSINSNVLEILENEFSGDDNKLYLIKRLLAHRENSHPSGRVMLIAAEKEDRRILELLVTHGGELTQDMLDGAADRVSAGCLDVFFDHGYQVTNKTLRKALERPWWKSNGPTLKLLHRVKETEFIQEMSILLPVLIQSGYQNIEVMS